MTLNWNSKDQITAEASPSPAFQRISSTPATFRGRIYKVPAMGDWLQRWLRSFDETLTAK